MSDSVSVTFDCPKCGGTILRLPDNYTDSSIVSCKSCGVEFGRWGDIKKEATEAAKGDVMAKLKSAFKGSSWN